MLAEVAIPDVVGEVIWQDVAPVEDTSTENDWVGSVRVSEFTPFAVTLTESVSAKLKEVGKLRRITKVNAMKTAEN
jgi:hypothetical protein